MYNHVSWHCNQYIPRVSVERTVVLNISMVNFMITLFACYPPSSAQFLHALWQLSSGRHGNEGVTKKQNLLETTLAQENPT